MGAVNPTGDWKPHPRFARVFLKPLVTREMNPGITVNLVRVAPGGEITSHTHDASTETFYVLAGRGVCRVGDEEFALETGVCGYAPPGITHTVRNIGDADLEAISIFNPPLA
jgi:mannose-6-phosphate isomerase-like protein (cupin superfamily)